MLVSDLLSAERVLPDVRVRSKKRLLEVISAAMADDAAGFHERDIFESLVAREKLGSTGLGNGVAIPHGRVAGASTVQAVFVRLARPVPFDAVDGEPVDLLFALAVPEHCTNDHLKLLAQIAELFSDAELVGALREAAGGSELLQLLSDAQR